MIQFIPILINSSRASRIHVLLCIWHCNLEFREKITLVFQSRPMGQVLQNRDISSLLLTTSQVGMLEPVGDGFLPSRSSSRQSSVSAKLYESDTGKKSAPESHNLRSSTTYSHNETYQPRRTALQRAFNTVYR